MFILFFERERNIYVRGKHQLAVSHVHPNWRSNPQPWYVLWLGIEHTIFWCMGRCSNQLSHPARTTPHSLAAPNESCSPSQTNCHLVPGRQENTERFLTTHHISTKPHIPQIITHGKVQDPGIGPHFTLQYIHVRSCVSKITITFRLALLVTKFYNYPGFKNKTGWYTLTITSFSYCRRQYLTK